MLIHLVHSRFLALPLFSVVMWLLPSGLLAGDSLTPDPKNPPCEHAPAGVELVGRVVIPGDTHDGSTFQATLSDGSPSNRLGGFSGIEYSGAGAVFYLLSDRGIGDGRTEYPTRFHKVRLELAPDGQIEFDVLNTVLLHWPDGEQLCGSQELSDRERQQLEHVPTNEGSRNWRAFDPESIRRFDESTLILSDEYGPHVVLSNLQGEILEEWKTPDSLRPIGGKAIGGTADSQTRGVSPNRGLESLAWFPDSRKLIVMPQSALVQDCRFNGLWFEGLHCRTFQLTATSEDTLNELATTAQWDYQFDDLSCGVSEILAADNEHLLVLERDGESGEDARFKRIYEVDLTSATTIDDTTQLLPTRIANGITPLKKKLVIDLLAPEFQLGSDCPEKPEGLSWGPDLPDGRRTLWVCFDNDFEASQDSLILCFAIGSPNQIASN